MKPQSAVRITPMINPHSRATRHEGAKTSAMDEVLERIKEKTRMELTESRKPKMLRKRGSPRAGEGANGSEPAAAFAPSGEEKPVADAENVKVRSRRKRIS